MRAGRLFIAALLVVCAAMPLTADEFRPAYLQLTQIDADSYDVVWKVPGLDESTTLEIRPAFPAGTETVSDVRSQFGAGTVSLRWRIRVAGGLSGKAIEFGGRSLGQIDVLARLTRRDGSVQLARILAAAPRFVVTDSPGAFDVARTYTVLGIEHILMGFDHLLFVLALVILVRGTRSLLITITTFTVAHSLTLAGAALGFIRVPGPPVEASIALSIVFVAVEIIHARRGQVTVTQRYPWIVAFAFGLLHGFGFASALAEVGLPQSTIPVALLFFNVGVEIGQVLFVAAVLTVAGLATRCWREPLPDWLGDVTPYAIGGLASFWLIERLVAF
jgi:hydrogenase/urease accessory protein HupE